MNIAPRYLGRGSWLARRDPRVLIVVIALFIFTVLQVWDGRVVFALLLVSVGLLPDGAASRGARSDAIGPSSSCSSGCS